MVYLVLAALELGCLLPDQLNELMHLVFHRDSAIGSHLGST